MDSNFILLITGRFTKKYIERTVLKKMKNVKHVYINEHRLVIYNENETTGYFTIEKGPDTRHILYTNVKDVEKLKSDLSKVGTVEDLDDSYKNSPIALIEYNDEGRQFNYFVKGYNNGSPPGYFLAKYCHRDLHDDIPRWFCFTTRLDVFPIQKDKISVISHMSYGGKEMWRDDDYKWYSGFDW
jgi:hypothetical protein